MKDTLWTPPPFDLTEDILGLVAEICEILGRLSADLPAERQILLRRANRIRTVHASLAVEGNTLGPEEVEAVLEGRRVTGLSREIQEVRNALDAYERLYSWSPYSRDDLCEAHGVLMAGLVDHPGAFRKGAAGIVGGDAVVHVAPPADRVPFLVGSLLDWLEDANVHALVRGCVLHYELEFIHPFVDGNGRVGRLWQTLFLSSWKPMCAVFPVEHVVRERQADYYAALRQADASGRSTPFIVFMLGAIREALEEAGFTGVAQGEGERGAQSRAQSRAQSDQVLAALVPGSLSMGGLVEALSLRSKTGALKRTVASLLEEGLVEHTIPDKPRSRLQRYRLTAKGRRNAAKSK